ncbi:F-box/LRR-repeat protein At3g26922-like [Miscanthus floridulus]|uniref:F-box/LRR-repeat protein At3g26922-like n=1 Tax=Miscanthus floridulus TaxID=154761 RepID=UPI003457C65C
MRSNFMVPAQTCIRFLPPPPSTTNAAQPAAAAVFFPAPGSSPSEDRNSQLPEDIRRTIVSKLPVKDGGATVVLSSSWRSIWSSIPLVLDDAQLRPAGVDGHIEDLSRDVVWDKVTAILRSHPAPFRSVRLTSSPTSSLRAWLRIMAAKGVKELVVLNCEWPTAMMVLSVELLRAARPGHRRAVHFPNLEELVLCHAFVPETDIGDFLTGCPVLKMLAFIEGCRVPPYIDVLCPRLKCLLLWQFKPLKLTVDAPRVERVILWRTNQFFIPPRTRILIRRAPNLRILGYLHPKLHVLESRNMVIKVRHTS